MKKIVTLLTVLFILALSACQAPAKPVEIVQEAPAAEPLAPESPADEAYPVEPSPAETVAETSPEPAPEEQVTVDYAKNFTLEYKDGYKLLSVVIAMALWQAGSGGSSVGSFVAFITAMLLLVTPRFRTMVGSQKASP